MIILNPWGTRFINYNLFKLLHIVSLVFWLGPTIGAYILIAVSHINKQHWIEMWLRREYLLLIYMETASFILLTLSGLGMLYSSRWILLKQWWLRRKLVIVLTAILPLVVTQFHIYNGPVKVAFITGSGIEEAILLYDRFSIVALAVLCLAVPAIFWLAVFKPKTKTDIAP